MNRENEDSWLPSALMTNSTASDNHPGRQNTSPDGPAEGVQGISAGDKIHFPGLNGLRFLAAFSVLLYHVEAFKSMAQMPNWIARDPWHSLGPYGVVCFFTLSGFLITYLLLEEQDRTGTIRVRKFYMRRILRIWPLYYLIVLLGFAALPLSDRLLSHPQVISAEQLLPTLPLFLLFLPNLAWVTYGVIPFAGPLWSVGVEEQFYLTWPILLRSLGKRVVLGMFLVILLMIALRFAAPAVAAHFSNGPMVTRNWQSAMAFLWTLKLECMAVGALGAYCVHRNFTRVLLVLQHPISQVAAIAFIVASLVFRLRYQQFDNLLWGVAFAILILNLAENPKSLIRLENRVLNYLGQISFGIYVFHSFVIAGLLFVLKDVMVTEGFVFNAILYSLATMLTILISAISHRYYETPFLRLKKRFTIIESSDRPQNRE